MDVKGAERALRALDVASVSLGGGGSFYRTGGKGCLPVPLRVGGTLPLCHSNISLRMPPRKQQG